MALPAGELSGDSFPMFHESLILGITKRAECVCFRARRRRYWRRLVGQYEDATRNAQEDKEFQNMLDAHVRATEHTIWCTGQEGDGQHCTRCAEPIYGMLCINLCGEALRWGCASSLLATVGVAKVPEQPERNAPPRQATAYRVELRRKLAVAVRKAQQHTQPAESLPLHPTARSTCANDGVDEVEVDQRPERGRTCIRRPHSLAEARREMEHAGVVGTSSRVSKRWAVQIGAARCEPRVRGATCEPQYIRRGIAHRGHQLFRRKQYRGCTVTQTLFETYAGDYSRDSGSPIAEVWARGALAFILYLRIRLGCWVTKLLRSPQAQRAEELPPGDLAARAHARRSNEQRRLQAARLANEVPRGVIHICASASLRHALSLLKPSTSWCHLRGSCKVILVAKLLLRIFEGDILAAVGVILHVLGWHAPTVMRSDSVSHRRRLIRKCQQYYRSRPFFGCAALSSSGRGLER